MFRVIGCVTESHDLMLLAVAVLVCTAAATAAVNMLARATGSWRHRRSRRWLAGAGLAYGLGVWATHFVAMLAFRPGLPVTYDIGGTGLSLLVAILGATAAFGCRAVLGRAGDLIGGLVLGGAIGLMHAIGLQAMRLPGSITVAPGFSLASIAIGVVCAVLGFILLRRPLIPRAAILCLALAVCGLHLTSMAGVEILPGLTAPDAGNAVLGSATLGVAVAAVACMIIIGCLLLAIFDRQLAGRDVEEARRQWHMAHHDPLTGLPNRALLDAAIGRALVPGQEGMALLCLSLRRFKPVNERLGHVGGDRILVEVAQRLRAAAGPGDAVARLAGDEFAILQQGGRQPGAAGALARRLADTLAEPFAIEGQEVAIGASIGIAFPAVGGMTAASLLRSADTALREARQDNRRGHVIFEAAMEQSRLERQALERDLRAALAAGDQLAVHYQPIIRCDSGRIIAYEALLRWNHPQRGPVSPIQLIAMAEATGLILPLGQWVLETACAEAATWTEPCGIAVNLSPAQFREADVAAMVAAVLKRTGLPAARLELEITEGLMLDDSAATLAILRSLRALGLRLSLDDFGTGYSSLSYLRRFPFDKLKIDQSFVAGLGHDPEAAAIIDAILGMARGLRLDVTAEGVETEAQLALLRTRGCPQAQGYLIGRPMARVAEPVVTRMPG